METTALINIDGTAEICGCSRSHIRRQWYSGHFPPPLRLGRRKIMWRRSDVEAFLASQPGASRPQTKEFA